MITFKANNFNLSQIAGSGQCFRMQDISNTKDATRFLVISLDKCAIATFASDIQTISIDCSCEDDDYFMHYFDLETDYQKIISSIDNKDSYLTECATYGSGIRILSQDPWEMLVTFLISQQNNISRIRKSVEALCEKYGKRIAFNDEISYYSFPDASAFAFLDEDSLMEQGLGYRSKYVVRTARAVLAGDIDLASLYTMDYNSAKHELLKLYGVGNKVADCILLFGYHKTEAFPIDTHVSSILAAHYPKGFPLERYSGYAGILQQYMFYYDLNH